MSGNDNYMRQLAEASRDMEGASLTIGARIDDDLANTIRETMRLPQFADGAKASDLSISIFGDAGNSHVLAVDTRLLLMRDAGEVTWNHGLFRFVEAPVEERMYTIDNGSGCVFVRGVFDSVEEAIRWADGRGDDEYRLYVQTDDGHELVEVWNATAYRRISLGLPEASVYGVETICDEEDDDDEDGTYYMVVRFKSEIVAVELEDTGDEPDVWRDLDAFDRREGTNLYDMLFEANVLGVVSDLGDSPYSPSIIIRNASDVEALLDEEE